MNDTQKIIQYFGGLSNRIPLKFLTDEEEGKFDSNYQQLCSLLEELEKYRSVGTVEQCQKAVERLTPVKPEKKADRYSKLIEDYYCPRCGGYFGSKGVHSVALFKQTTFCQGPPEEPCGQAIDWGI